MYQFLQVVQYSVANLAGYWTALSDVDRAGASFVGGILMVFLSIKDRDFEYTSIAMGLGALLMFAYTLAVTIDFLH